MNQKDLSAKRPIPAYLTDLINEYRRMKYERLRRAAECLCRINGKYVWRLFGFKADAEPGEDRCITEIARICEDGSMMLRCIESTQEAGYVIYLPGERINWAYMEQDREWSYYNEGCRIPNLDSLIAVYGYDNKAYQDDEESKYIMSAIEDRPISAKVKIMQNFRSDKRTELIAKSMLFSNIAEDKRLRRLSEESKAVLMKYLRKHLNDLSAPYVTIPQILFCEKNGIDVSDYDRCSGFHGKQIDYIKKHKDLPKPIYHDILKMARLAEKSKGDPYWEQPSDWHETHRKLVEISERIEKAEIEKEEMEKKTRLQKSVEKFLKGAAPIKSHNGLTVYMPTDYEDIQLQAKQLKQCLITCSYDEKMADGKSMLIFVRTADGKPLATCELGLDKSIIQFRGDESDWKHCEPPKKAIEAVETFIRSIRKKKAVANKCHGERNQANA